MEKSTRQKLLPSLFIFILLLTQGITGLIKGIDNHQNWRIVLASAGIAITIGGMIFVYIKTRPAEKV